MILILGAGGFLGFSFSSYLSENGQQFYTISRSFQWDKLPGETRFVCSVSSFSDFSGICDNLTTVIYMAGATDLADAESRSALDLSDHVSQMESFFTRLRSLSVQRCRFIFFSSAGTVYGDSDGTPSCESDLLMPKSAYGRRNALLEHLFLMSVRSLGARPLVLRVSNPFGPFQFRFRRKGLIQSLISSSFSNESIVLRGSGRQVRDYIYVDDLVSSIYSLIALENWPFQILNVGSGYGFSANEIVEILNCNGLSPVVTRSVESSEYDVDCSVVDNTALCSVLRLQSEGLYPLSLPKINSLIRSMTFEGMGKFST